MAVSRCVSCFPGTPAGRRPQPIKLPHHQGVAGAQLVQDLLEDRAVGAGAAGRFGEHPVAAGASEGVDLEVGLLVGGWRRAHSRADGP
jgi:hypothetical protein